MSKPITDTTLNSVPQTARLIQGTAWTLTVLVCLLAVIAWGDLYAWHLWPTSLYQLFPLLGLLAFSIMWSHYMMNAVRNAFGEPRQVLSKYFRSTSYAVLVLLCLHPGLLVYQRFRDGYGLPPGSYQSYVAPGLGWVVMLGLVSLLVFLAFEFYRKFARRSWWHYVADASDLAMLAVIYHGLRLGGHLQHGWFRGVWFFYGITLVLALIYKYYRRYRGQ